MADAAAAAMPIRLVAVDVTSFNPSPEALDAALALLEPESAARIRRFRRREDALRCLIGRLVPLHALHEEQIVPAAPVRVATTAHGRPYFNSPLSKRLNYNVSHDGSLVVGAWRALERGKAGVGEVGVDVMRLGLPSSFPDYPMLLEALSDQLAPSERQHLAALPDDEQRTDYLLRLWTFKEAVSKLLGLGSAIDFSTLAFDLAPYSPTDATAARLESTSPALLPDAARGIGLWEGRLGAEQEAYGVVVAFRGQAGRSEGDGEVLVQQVAVEDVLAGARALLGRDP